MMEDGGNQENQPAIIDQIYDKLDQLFGEDTQLFCMEFPGRVLNESSYSYETGSIYSLITKPQNVLEEEFRLTNDLFDVAKIAGGPNGSKLSTTYELALNLLMPKYQSSPDYENDKARLREWLLTEVEETVDGKPIKYTRMQLFQKLNQTYLMEKSKWDQEKNIELKKAISSQDSVKSLEEYSKWLVNEAPVREAQIEALFADLVVRGYYHEIKNDLGYLDVKTIAEQLDEAKSRLRLSGMSSLDESETIYPIQLQPVDWFKSLSTDFTSEDLCLDPEFIQSELITKQQELSDLEVQYQSLQVSRSGDADKIQEQVNAAQSQLDKAQSEMIKNFSDAVITAIQIYYAQKKNNVPEEDLTDFNSKLDKKAGDPLTEDQWKQILSLQNNTIEAQQNLTSSSRVLTELQARLAEAKSTDTSQSLIILKSKIDSLRNEIKGMRQMLILSYGNTDNEIKDQSKVPLMPSKMPPASNFFDVVMDFNTEKTYDASTLSSGASHTSWSVDVLFGSAGGSNDESWSKFVSEHTASKTDFTIGFRATKVTIDRGGWFNPEFFKMTKDMSHAEIDDKSYQTIANKLPDENIKKITDGTMSNLNKGIFPAYPVSFIIAKDVTIKVHIEEETAKQASDILNKSSSVGGGFLCFSASHSESSNSQTKSFYSANVGKDLIIKIPGPQILGWFLELVPEDASVGYTKMPDTYLPPDKPSLVKDS